MSADFGPAWAKVAFGADGIVYFDPFHFEVEVYARISAGVTIDTWISATITISISIGAHDQGGGPDFHGRATFEVGPIELSVEFGSSNQGAAVAARRRHVHRQVPRRSLTRRRRRARRDHVERRPAVGKQRADPGRQRRPPVPRHTRVLARADDDRARDRPGAAQPRRRRHAPLRPDPAARRRADGRGRGRTDARAQLGARRRPTAVPVHGDGPPVRCFPARRLGAAAGRQQPADPERRGRPGIERGRPPGRGDRGAGRAGDPLLPGRDRAAQTASVLAARRRQRQDPRLRRRPRRARPRSGRRRRGLRDRRPLARGQLEPARAGDAAWQPAGAAAVRNARRGTRHRAGLGRAGGRPGPAARAGRHVRLSAERGRRARPLRGRARDRAARRHHRLRLAAAAALPGTDSRRPCRRHGAARSQRS